MRVNSARSVKYILSQSVKGTNTVARRLAPAKVNFTQQRTLSELKLVAKREFPEHFELDLERIHQVLLDGRRRLWLRGCSIANCRRHSDNNFCGSSVAKGTQSRERGVKSQVTSEHIPASKAHAKRRSSVRAPAAPAGVTLQHHSVLSSAAAAAPPPATPQPPARQRGAARSSRADAGAPHGSRQAARAHECCTQIPRGTPGLCVRARTGTPGLGVPLGASPHRPRHGCAEARRVSYSSHVARRACAKQLLHAPTGYIKHSLHGFTVQRGVASSVVQNRALQPAADGL
jgi:hypothetical protein